MAKNDSNRPTQPAKQPARKEDRSSVPGKVIHDDSGKFHRQQAPQPDPQPVKKK